MADAIQRFNSYLHEIADLCGIHKSLTSHVGRRTFATTIALGNGISLETISKMLGHKTTKITAQYTVVTDHKISEEMNILRDKLSKKKADYKICLVTSRLITIYEIEDHFLY